MLVENPSLHCRVVVIGDASVGKTSLLNRLIDKTFKDYQPTTIGANYQLYIEEINGTKVELQVWDTAGQERFKSLGPIYFRNSLGTIAVFDQTNRESFENMQEWINSFREVAGTDTIICVAGNKCDLQDDVQVSDLEAKEWATKKHYLYGRTSAKTGEGVAELFKNLASTLLSFQTERHKGRNEKRMKPHREKENCC